MTTVYSIHIRTLYVEKYETISALSGNPLKLEGKFIYLGSSISSIESDVNIHRANTWNAIDRLSIIWKSDLSQKIKEDFFWAVVVPVLLYGCTTWALMKRVEKNLNGNYIRMLRALLNKSWKQHTTKQQLYGHLPPISQTISVRRTRHAQHCWWRYKRCYFMRFCTWMRQCWLTSKNLHISVLCIHLMRSGRPAKCNLLWRGMARERVKELRAISMTRWWWLWW